MAEDPKEIVIKTIDGMVSNPGPARDVGTAIKTACQKATSFQEAVDALESAIYALENKVGGYHEWLPPDGEQEGPRWGQAYQELWWLWTQTVLGHI